MKTKVWQVKMGDLAFPKVATSTMNVCANTLRQAISKAEKSEKALCDQMAEDEGEKITADKAIACEFLCELDD
jgi:hypothetical protein